MNEPEKHITKKGEVFVYVSTRKLHFIERQFNAIVEECNEKNIYSIRQHAAVGLRVITWTMTNPNQQEL